MSGTAGSNQTPLAIAAGFLHEAPVDLLAMAEALGLTVDLNAALSRDLSGRIVRRNGGAGYHIEIQRAHSANRKRFTLAHEIAHYLIHREMIGDGIEDNGLYRSPLGTRIEVEANQLAARMLMPSALVRRLYEAGLRSLAALATAFQVSEDAMKVRLERLGLGQP